MNKYDGLYVFTGAVKDEALDKLVEKATAEITRLNGKVVSTAVIGKKTFARPMHKKDNGVYVKIRFELDPLQVTALINRYHLVEEVFRVQILAVDERREAILAEQAKLRKAREAKREAAKAKAEQEAAEKAAAKAAADADAEKAPAAPAAEPTPIIIAPPAEEAKKA